MHFIINTESQSHSEGSDVSLWFPSVILMSRKISINAPSEKTKRTINTYDFIFIRTLFVFTTHICKTKTKYYIYKFKVISVT